MSKKLSEVVRNKIKNEDDLIITDLLEDEPTSSFHVARSKRLQDGQRVVEVSFNSKENTIHIDADIYEEPDTPWIDVHLDRIDYYDDVDPDEVTEKITGFL